MISRTSCSVVILFVSMLVAVPGFSASGFAPTVDKSFTPPVVAVNEVSILTITLTNPNSTPIIGASITDPFPAGLVNAGPFPGTGATTCGGGFVSPSPTALRLTSGTIPANGSCTVIAPVYSASGGLYTNETGHVFSTAPASLMIGVASLTVISPVPSLSGWLLLLLGLTLAAVGLSRV